MPIFNGIFYQDHAAGDSLEPQVVVLLHGAGGTHLSWPANIRRLPGFRVLAPDLPGHGKSGMPGLTNISAYAQAMADWLAQLGLDQAMFIGHSMGGAVALALALTYPRLVQAMVLIGTGARLGVAADLINNLSGPTPFTDAVNLITQRSFGSEATASLKTLAAKRMAESCAQVYHDDFLACNTFDVRDQVPHIRQPVLLVWGGEDQMTTLEDARFLEQNLAQARLVLLPGAGHMVMLEKPAQVAWHVQSFFENLAD